MNASTTKIVAIVIAAVMAVAGVTVYIMTNNSGNDKVKIEAGLEVYGNADGDYKIDSSDLKIIENIIASKDGYTLDKYPLADANNDGAVNAKDTAIVRSILAKEKTTIWHINHNTAGDNVVSTKWPITSAVASGAANALGIYVITGIQDNIKGIYYSAQSPPDSKIYEKFSKMPSIGGSSITIDLDTVSDYVTKYGCTAVIASDNKSHLAKEEAALEKMNIDVVRIKPAAVSAKELGSALLMVGFLFQKENRALEVTSWITTLYNDITVKINTIPESKRVTAMASSSDNNVSTKNSDYTDVIRMAGAKCPVDSRTDTASSIVIGDWLYTADMNPDKIIQLRTGGGLGGSWYDNSVSKLKMKEVSDKFKLTKAYKANEVFVISGDIPIVARVAYSASALYPTIFSDSYADGIHQEFVDKFLGGLYKVSSLKFKYLLSEMGA